MPTLLRLRDVLESMVERVDVWRRSASAADMQAAYGMVRAQLARDLGGVNELIRGLDQVPQTGVQS